MFKQLSIAMLLLFGGSMVFSQNNGFEYIFDIEEPLKIFEDIVELPDGNFVLYGHDGNLCEFSSTGEFIKEKNINAQVLGCQQGQSTLLHVDNVGNMYIFRAYNPILDTTAGDYVPGGFNSRITISMLDEDFETTSTINIPVTIDTADWQNIWSDHSYDRVYPRIELGTVIEIENEGFVISFKKLIGEANGQHLWSHGLDSTIFYKIDYEGNVLQKNWLEHSKCTGDMRNRNHLLYDEEQDKFYYYMSYDWDSSQPRGFIVFQLDNDFNLIEENIMPKTEGYGNYTYHLRDNWSITDGITLKRTSDHTTILGSSMVLFIRANQYWSAVCMEINDNAIVLDSTHFGTMPRVDGIHRTSVPSCGSMDWADENRIFFGYTPHALFSYAWGLPAEHQYFMLTLLDRNLNTTKELYYPVKADSTFLWVNTLKATSDGGCIIGGHFWNFVDNPIYNPQYLQSVITKFPAEAFDGIDTPHHYGLQIAVAYPNPGNDELNIRTTLQNAVAEVYSLQGQLMCSQPVNDIITTFNTDSWSSGTYLWRVIKDGQVCEHGKWVKL